MSYFERFLKQINDYQACNPGAIQKTTFMNDQALRIKSPKLGVIRIGFPNKLIWIENQSDNIVAVIQFDPAEICVEDDYIFVSPLSATRIPLI